MKKHSDKFWLNAASLVFPFLYIGLYVYCGIKSDADPRMFVTSFIAIVVIILSIWLPARYAAWHIGYHEGLGEWFCRRNNYQETLRPIGENMTHENTDFETWTDCIVGTLTHYGIDMENIDLIDEYEQGISAFDIIREYENKYNILEGTEYVNNDSGF